MKHTNRSENRYVYSFGGDTTDGGTDMRDVLGNKGANLAEMSRLGLPVPPGFTIAEEVCGYFNANDGAFPPGLEEEMADALRAVEARTGTTFGDADNPLLLSVRSGARVSMPGMMDTVLNLGLNDTTVKGLASAGERFAQDSYRRFIQMYGDVVLGVDHGIFEDIIQRRKDERGVSLDTELDAEDWRAVITSCKEKVRETAGKEFPQDPRDQLHSAIGAVFRSWRNPRAETWRRINNIPADWGTAVTVQSMVFGNMGDDCASGVAFTRNPATGTRELFGEFLINAQGEDVVAGTRTPLPLTGMEERMPDAWSALVDAMNRLETHYRDMQDVEFTVQRGKLYMLQTRSGKRTAAAALKIAVDMVEEGLIDREDAVRRIDPDSLEKLLHPTLDPSAPRRVIARGLAASPGAACGRLALTADDAEARTRDGEDVILARVETSPEDIHGMHAARGIMTARGGMTSHAAVVARGMGRPCVSGADDLKIDTQNGTVTAGGVTLGAGDMVTIDGGSGEIIAGEVPMIPSELGADFEQLMGWADEIRTLRVRTNAETVAEARRAREFGAEGIGLCRTEHMFFDEERIPAIRRAIMAETTEERQTALEELLPMQRSDFTELFEIMAGLPVTVRLLDPPLHEFLPQRREELADMARMTGRSVAEVEQRAAELREANPMLGHRGCRLGLTWPEIYDMQARAVFEAVLAVSEPVILEIMIPLAATGRELELLRQRIDAVAASVTEETGRAPEYIVGTMVELPRACLRAGDLAHTAEFFSFGTNDLTQTALGISRDDSGRFLDRYIELGIFKRDPFVTIDTDGVGELVTLAVERGKRMRGDLQLGICGEHGGDPASVAFFHRLGLDYVSCSPWRVPVARLAAAQAVLAEKRTV